MPILVTGGKGFIGSRLIRNLVQRDLPVVCLDLKGTAGRLAGMMDKVTMVEGDIVSYDDVARVLRDHGIDRIAHMVFFSAEERGVRDRPERATELYRQQMIMNTGTFHLFEAARIAGIQTIVFPSSIQYHGYDRPWDGPLPVSEESPPRPTTAYGIGKHLCEHLADAYNRNHGMRITSFRIPAVYGPGVKTGARGVNLIGTEGALGKVVRFAYQRDQRMVLAHVDDLADVLAKSLVETPSSRLYQIGGHYVSFGELAALGRELVPEMEVEFNDRGALVSAFPIDSTRAEREMGLKRRSLRTGFSALIRETRGEHGCNG